MKSRQNKAVLMLFGIFSLILQFQAQTQNAHMAGDHLMVMPGEINWVEGPASLPPGAKFAMIDGDLKAAGPFTLRIKMPANYTVMPHWHPADEHITLIEGSLYMGLGETLDEGAAKEIPPGGYAVMNKGTRHFAYSKNDCIVQVHGIGPWGITYVNSADDPRNKK